MPSQLQNFGAVAAQRRRRFQPHRLAVDLTGKSPFVVALRW
jgi:hypothetical protein